MPNHRKRKFHAYSEESMQKALETVRNGAKIRETCKMYGVPRATLQDRLKGRIANKPRKMGPNPYLSMANEQKIVEWITNLAKCGFPIKKQELISTIQKIVLDEKIVTPFKDGKPGQKWFTSFLRRHPEVCSRTAESVDIARARLTEESIKFWFRELENFLEEIGATDILQESSRIFNADESGFSLCPKTGKVLGPKGYKNVFQVKKGNEKENLTVLATISADGKFCPPCIVFPYVKPPKAIAESMPPDWILGRSDTGWMKADVFFEYIANGFHKWVLREEIKTPILFFVDGHRSHMSLELSKFCDDNGIILYALPPNATHIMQPADVALFKPLKEYWRQAVRDWQNKNMNKTLTKTEFAPVFQKAFNNPKNSEHIKQGFKRCGLFPYNSEAVDYTKCVQNKLENLQLIDQPNKLSAADFEATEKVLTQFKFNLDNRVGNIDCLLQELKVFKEKILDHNEPQQNIHDDLVAGEPLMQENENENSFWYNVNDDGSLSMIQPVDHIILNKDKLENSNLVTDNPEKNLMTDDNSEENLVTDNSKENLMTDNPEDNMVTDDNSEDNLVTNNPKENLMTENPEDNMVTDSPQDNLMTDNPEDNLVTDNLEENLMTDNPEENFMTDNPEDNLVTDNPEDDLVTDNLEENLMTDNNPENNLVMDAIKVNDKAVCSNSDFKSSDFFNKHLKYPKPVEKSKRPRKGPSTSAISAEAWRLYYIEKENEKMEKENAKKRRRDEYERKSGKSVKSKKKSIVKERSKEKEVIRKQKCGVCEDELDTDAEEEGEKNVGCDMCPRWFHLNCTKLAGQPYNEVSGQDFYCDFCSD